MRLDVSLQRPGFYLHGGLERGGVRVVRQALAITLLLHTQQDLDVLTVLVAAGLLVALHPRLDLVLPQRRVLRRLLLWSCALRGQHSEQNSGWQTQLQVSAACVCGCWSPLQVYLYSGGLPGPLSESLSQKKKKERK